MNNVCSLHWLGDEQQVRGEEHDGSAVLLCPGGEWLLCQDVLQGRQGVHHEDCRQHSGPLSSLTLMLYNTCQQYCILCLLICYREK